MSNSPAPIKAAPPSISPPAEARAPLWRVGILLAIVLLLLMGYYWVHKPVNAGQALYIGGALLDLATVGALFAVGGAIGRVLLDAVLDRRGGKLSGAELWRPALTAGERVALDGVFGLGAISLIALACGLLGVAVGREFWLLLVVVALLLRRPLLAWLRDVGAAVRAVRPDTTAEGAALLYIGVLLALALIYALNPPAQWDSLAYHLVGVARTLRDGRILPAPDNPYLGFPENMEMLFRIVMSLFGRDTAPALVHYGFGIFGLLAAAGAARRAAGRGAGWLTLLLLISAFSLWDLFRWSYVDLAIFACGALTLVAASRWRETGGVRWLIVLGALCGLAAGVKYTGGLLAFSVGLFVIAESLIRKTPRRFVRHALIAGGAALIVFAPWMIKALLLYGNPVYPFVFGGLEWDTARGAFFAHTERSLITDGLAWQIPLLPFAATVYGLHRSAGFSFSPGPFLMTLWVLLPVVWCWTPAGARRIARDAGVLLLPLLVAWAILSATSLVGQQTRLMIMVLPLFAVASAMSFVGLARFPRKPVYVGFIVRVLLVMTLLMNALDVLSWVVDDGAVAFALDRIDTDAWRYRQTGAHMNALKHLADLPDGARVRFLWEPRIYYCPSSIVCNADTILDYWSRPQLASGVPDAAAVLDAYREADDYWLVFDTGYRSAVAESLRPEIDAALPAFLERYMTPVWTDGLHYTVWVWKDAP